MAARDYQSEISKIDLTLKSIEQVLNLPKLVEAAADLEQQASVPNLWDDPQAAQVITSKLSRAQSTINKINGIRSRLDDLPVMVELANSESDKAAAFKEIDKELDTLTQVINDLEVQTLLSGEYDERDALMTIRSEAGGVEAADWAQMLMRMYLRFCERNNYKVEVLETSYAEEAGIKSSTFRISSPYAYGRLSVEQGTHRLVRISPFDSQSRRHTSFAGVEVVPVVEQSDHIEIDEKDLRIDVYRSSGPGGQGVNTTDSAVRITHIPSGIVVSCQNERSQIQNRATAMAVLQSKLLERRRLAERAKMDALKGDNSGSWGNQMRSYVLAPYQMVKDLRESVTKLYAKQEKPALDGVTLEIAKGEFVFLVGLSGSGKSTFLRLVLREERPTAGVIHVAGKELNTLANHKVPELRRQVGTVFQDFRLLPNKTVSENVAFTLHVLGYPSKQISREVPEVLDLVGLGEKSDRKPSELSGGEQQRVAIARAYVSRPTILIADEPTGNLDPATSVGIMKLLDRINREGTTVVMATHDSGIVDQMRKRVIELEDGHVIRDQARGVYGYTG